ncbi:FUSC family protein [Nonomuraea sp. LPB2021202275-12-8]|uniref:FUSC family protein n=1 Tax=Nonomuraea sp. LPB2021202275-12-8 TaxID=3120159 RepID=UPI00300D4E98
MEDEPRGRPQTLPPLERIARHFTLVLERARRLGIGHWLRAERQELAQTVKVTGSCVIAWWLAAWVLKADVPVLAPIGVLLTVSATAYSTVVRGVQQVGAVLVGVAAAIALIRLIGSNFVTLAVLVVAGLVLTRLLNLPKQNVQIPITALLVFALGDVYGKARLLDLLLGAGVGIAANLLVLPPRYVEEAQKDLADLAGDLAELAADIGAGLRGSWEEDDGRRWLDRARELARRLEDSKEMADQAAESVRLTVRRRSRYEGRLDQVAEAMTCLDHACQQLRSIARSLVDLVAGVRGLPAEEAADLPRALGEELEAISRAFSGFGRLQVGRGSAKDLNRLRDALREGERQQSRVVETVKDTEHVPLWSLYGSMLDQCAAIRHELDPDNGPHRAAFPAHRLPR